MILSSMVERGLIDFWAFIVHKPDIDDLKEHNHIYMRPCKIVNSDSIQKEFIEPDPKAGLPRKALIIRKSNSFGDWYLYGLHDREYLKCRGLERNVHYGEADFYCSDQESFNMLKNEIDTVALKGFVQMLELASEGFSLENALKKGIIPMSRAAQWSHIYRYIQLENGGSQYGK